MLEPQPRVREIAPYLVPALIGLAGILMGAFLSYQLGLNTQVKLTGKQKRQQAYSALMGQQALVIQLTTSGLIATTYFYYHEAKWHLAGGATEASLHLEEARRWQHKSENLALERAKSYQGLYETLGLIRSYFPYSTKLKELTNQLYHSKWADVKRHEINWNAEQLEAWREKTIKEIQEIADKEGKLFNELVIYLETEIDKESR